VRYPSVSRFHFHECSGNGLTDWLKPRRRSVAADPRPSIGRAVDRVPASTLLEEAGIDPARKWVLFEGRRAQRANGASIPMGKKCERTRFIVYAITA